MLKNRRKTTKKRVFGKHENHALFWKTKICIFFVFHHGKKQKGQKSGKQKTPHRGVFCILILFSTESTKKIIFFLQKSRFKSSNFHSARFSFLTSFLRHQLLILLFPLYIHMTHDCPFTCCMSGGEWFVILNPIRVMFLTSDVIINFSPKEVAKHFYLAVTDKVRVQTTQ